MNDVWFKEWGKMGYVHDSNFMKHNGNEYDSSGRVFVRDFITKKSIKSIVDIGCGPLVDLEYIIQDKLPVEEYIGYDVNKYDRWSEFNLPQWAKIILTNNPYKIKEPDNRFQLVYTRHTLEHQEDHIKFLKELHRICKQYVVLVFFLSPSDLDVHKTEMWMKFYCKTYSKKLLMKECQTIGFNLLEVHEFFGNSTDAVWVMSPRGGLDKKS